MDTGTDFNGSFTVVFWDERGITQAGVKLTTSPYICCHTTLWKLNVQLCIRKCIGQNNYLFKFQKVMLQQI